MLNIFNRLLDRINDGRFVGGIVAICLKVFAGIAALGGLVAVIATLKLAFNAGVPTSVTMAALVIAALFVAAAGCVAQICLYRGARVAQLGDSEYPVIGIAAELCRMAGEVGATLITVLGLATFVAAVMAGQMIGDLSEVLPGPFGRLATSGFGAFIALLLSAALAFIFLVGWYLYSEALQLCVNVAADVRQSADRPARLVAGEAGTAPYSAASMSARTRCANCATELVVGNAFCTHCGQTVAQGAHG